ncbi:YegP family protein [Neisseria sp. Ec49-e6-T10]|uniref:YegP family protein n=1 Tax=Neisseria sp. Ec49-e6-T10 TaxID=3140744 RepID=UPI003EB95822
MSGSYTIKKAKDGQFYFHLTAKNGEIILTSEMYRQKNSALSGIQSVQNNCVINEHFHKVQASNEKFYFTLKAANHQVIGQSQLYTSEQGCEKGIQSVKANGPTTIIHDETLN